MTGLRPAAHPKGCLLKTDWANVAVRLMESLPTRLRPAVES